MKLYVIVVTYNGSLYIEGCLDSIYNSDIELKVIVVDNNSKDNTIELIENRFSDVIILKQPENLGFGKANNIGLSYALQCECDHVFLLNQDAKVEARTIRVLKETSDNNLAYGIISPVHLNKDGTSLDDSFLYYFKNNNDFLSDLLLRKPCKEIYSFNMVNAAAWLLPVRTLHRVGGFDPMFFLYGEDDNYCQRVLFHGFKIGVVPDVYIKHDTKNNYILENKKGTQNYYKKFLNQLKVKYGNVNTSEYQKIQAFQKLLIKQCFKSIIKFDLQNLLINYKKYQLIKELDFQKSVEENRKIKMNYFE